MYSNKINIHTLTSLLLQHGIRDAVVCPGSRNAPIVHHFSATGQLHCHAVTDERSAGFYAVGMAQATGRPVVVCVTSGSALSNLAPAVAEAYYQQVPIIVVSGDRPRAWIDQIEGQTLRQTEVLRAHIAGVADIEDFTQEEEHWYANRLINEVLVRCATERRPIHINMRLHEPLFETLNTMREEERTIKLQKAYDVESAVQRVAQRMKAARAPMLVIGQMEKVERCVWEKLQTYGAVCCEPLSVDAPVGALDDLMAAMPSDVAPDFVLHVGGGLVSKSFRKWLRANASVEVWRIEREREINDTFQHLTEVISAEPLAFLVALSEAAGASPHQFGVRFGAWAQELTQQIRSTPMDFGQAYCVKELEARVAQQRKDKTCAIHYANSMAVRLGCRYAQGHLFVNRGVNGIDGSVSTAAGFSVAAQKRTYLVTGDLSFFYDQNALWSTNDLRHLRIVLLNNGGGAIFDKVKGLPADATNHKYVWAQHTTNAKGICEQNRIDYMYAATADEYKRGLKELTAEDEGARLLEVDLRALS